jgi:hypothetical protein
MRIQHVFVTMVMIGAVTPSSVMASWFYSTGEVGIAAELVGVNLLPTENVGANRTFRVWAVMPAGWRLEAIAGNSSQVMSFTTDGAFYQDPFGGGTSLSVNAAFMAMAPDLEWDSWLTIGARDSSGTGAPGTSNDMGYIGLELSEFELGNSIVSDNGGCWVLPIHEQGDAIGFTDGCGRSGNGVLIGQFTLLGEGATLSGSVLLQGGDNVGETWQRAIPAFTIDPDGVSNAIPQVACAADIDGDGRVDVQDLLALLAAWSTGACADISGDARVDQDDFLYMVGSWGPCS